MSIENYQPVEDAFRDGTIDEHDSATLGNFLMALSNQPLENDRVKHRDIIRGITINHILLKRHIDALDKKNDLTQKLVIALTIASLIGTGAQTWFALKADKRAEEPVSQATETQSQKSSAVVPVAQKAQALSPASSVRSQAASATK
jgi:hypothetical protein